MIIGSHVMQIRSFATSTSNPMDNPTAGSPDSVGRHIRAILRAGMAATLAVGAPQMSMAQEAASPEDAITELVVTGTRVARDGYSAPTPVNVVTEEEIRAVAPSNIADYVNTMPSVAGSTTPASSSGAVSPGGAGISALNLRSLGSNRTLVLFDGQRSVVSTSTGSIDINTFPQALIERVEVVTGGASSAYGSDAIGGVVNFILDKTFTGMESELQYGETFRGDAGQMKYSVTGGMPFADGRGHALLSMEGFERDGIQTLDREWAEENQYFAVTNNAADYAAGGPYYYVDNNMGWAQLYPGGRIIGPGTSGGAIGTTYFGAGGVPLTVSPGKSFGSSWQQGGDATYATSAALGQNTLEPSERRKSVFGRVSWDLTDTTNVFAQVAWGRYQGASYYVRPTESSRFIAPDNYYLVNDPRYAALRAAYPTGFRIATSNADFPQSGSDNIRQTYRYVVGADGDFTLGGLGITWDTYYQKGITKTDELLTNTWSNQLLNWASDAVADGSGNPACRINVDASTTNDDPACVPLNRLGTGVANPAAIAYVTNYAGTNHALGGPFREQEFTQDVAALNFTTNEIGGWAGPISMATGVEWRKEESDGEVDPYFEPGSSFNNIPGLPANTWKYGNYRATKGSYNVKEVFLETVVPVFRDFDLNGAARYTDYSISGGVTTWKLGATWQVIEDVKLRATTSLDIRAPNLAELFDPGTGRGNTVPIPPGTNYTAPKSAWVRKDFTQRTQGSTLLEPEEADGFGVGIVFTPRFLPGFAASVDYYKVTVEGVMASLSVENTIDNCYLSNVAYYCNNIVWATGTDTNGDGRVTGMEGNANVDTLSVVNLYTQNLNSMVSEGIDVEASYRFSPGWAPGDLSLRLMGTHYMKNITDNGVTAINLAGSNQNNTPDWLYRLQATYTQDNWTWNLVGRGFTSGVISNAYIECQSNCPAINSAAGIFTINDNSVPGANYLDASVTSGFNLFGSDAEAYLSVTNLLDRDPELVGNPAGAGSENVTAYLQTNRSLYDVLGRRFNLGVRFSF